MTLSWIPDALKQQVADRIVEFIAGQAEGLAGQELGDRLRGFTRQGQFRQALLGALQRGVERFEREYADEDEDLTAAILAAPDFWQDRQVQQAALTLVTSPGLARPAERGALVDHFGGVLPGRRNRERVDRAVSFLLRVVAEEVWAIPGADSIRDIYRLQMERLTADALQEQVALLRASVQQTQELGEGMRQALLQLTGAAEQKLLAAPAPSVPARTRPFHNLPNRSYTKFIGRGPELRQLKELLSPATRHFVVTLLGIGGVGKSTLALECAYHFRDSYASLAPEERFEAIVWVSAKRTELTASGITQRTQEFRTLGDLYREIAITLDEPAILQAEPAQRRALVRRLLTTQRTLLVVDNLETVDDEELLAFLRDLPVPTKAIVTTRHRIDIALAVPLAGMSETDALVLMAYEAPRKGVELPVEHAGDLYRRTGGIPLAIVWSIGRMALGIPIEHVLRRLGEGHSDVTRFCFTESYELLRGTDGQRLLLALALFDGSVARDMLGHVAGIGGDVLGRDEGLARLEQLSLVSKHGDRFSLLPLTRVFVREELSQAPDQERALRERWASYLVQLGKPFGGLHWRYRDRSFLHREGDHYITLAAWARANGRPDILLGISPALTYYYDMTGQWSELLHLAVTAVEYAELVGDLETFIFIKHFISWVRSHQGYHDEAEQASFDSLAAARRSGDGAWICAALHNCAQAARRRNAFDRARAYCEEALALVPQLPEAQQYLVRADMLYALGKAARDEGRWEEARRHLLSARTIFQVEAQDPIFNVEFAWGLMSSLGYVEHQLGNLDEAARIYDQSLKLYRTTGGKGDLATMLVRYAALEADRGNREVALQYAQEALEWSRRLGMFSEREQAERLVARLSGRDAGAAT